MRSFFWIGLVLGCVCLFLYLACHAPGYKESRKYKKAVEQTKAMDENEQPTTGEDDLTFGVAPITAEMIYEEKAVVSKKLMDKCKEANVWVKGLVNKEGNIEQVQIAKSDDCDHEETKAAIDSAAIQAAYQCKYKLAIQNGKPVAVWVTYKVDFELID